MEEDTIFRIYSMTKPIVSVAAMMLFEEGSFPAYPVSDSSRDSEISRFSEEDPETGAWVTEKPNHPVTIRTSDPHFRTDLWSSGAHHPVARRYNEMQQGDASPLDQVVEKILEQPLAFQPGSRWHTVSPPMYWPEWWKSFPEKASTSFCSKAVRPLGMKDTGYFLPAEKHGRLSEIYCIANWFDHGNTPEDLEQQWREGAVASRWSAGKPTMPGTPSGFPGEDTDWFQPPVIISTSVVCCSSVANGKGNAAGSENRGIDDHEPYPSAHDALEIRGYEIPGEPSGWDSGSTSMSLQASISAVSEPTDGPDLLQPLHHRSP